MDKMYDYEDFLFLKEIVKGYANTSHSKSKVECVEIHFAGYSEPGYHDPDSGIIATGDWNTCSEMVDGRHVTVDDSMYRFSNILEALGADLQWEDEWSACYDCQRLVRTSPDSYGYQPSYTIIDECELVCHECIPENPSDYLESLEGEIKANTMERIYPGSHGYTLLQKFERGMHYGQDDDPEAIAKTLSQAGFERFIFNIDSTGQFDFRFSVWLHDEEAQDDDGLSLIRAKRALENGVTQGRSPSEALKGGLAEVSMKHDAARKSGETGVIVASIGLEGASVKIVSQEDFLEGKGLK